MKLEIKLFVLLFFLIHFQCARNNKSSIVINEQVMYTKSDILLDLESSGNPNPYKFFLILGDENVFLSSCKINLFADDKRWAIVFEKTAYSTPAGHMTLELYYFGNCLQNLDKAGSYNQFVSNLESFSPFVKIKDLKAIETDFELVSKDAKDIIVRNIPIPIEHDKSKYEEVGIHIDIDDEDNPLELIRFSELTRFLNEKHPALFSATDEELRTCLPIDLPKLMTIDKWHHRDYYVSRDYPEALEGSKPSEYETFLLIADVLVSKDTTRWKPTLMPNNDWRNWNQW